MTRKNIPRLHQCQKIQKLYSLIKAKEDEMKKIQKKIEQLHKKLLQITEEIYGKLTLMPAPIPYMKKCNRDDRRFKGPIR